MAAEGVNKPPSLPPYPQLIMNAIEALKEENGSDKSSISKYIEFTYGELPEDHATQLSDHLAKMKEDGELMFWKNNYTKRGTNAPPRRGRGRPPKPKPLMLPGTNLGAPRPRGRPPKDPNAPPRPPKAKASTGSGRPRGRPRKMAQPAGGFGGAPATLVGGLEVGLQR